MAKAKLGPCQVEGCHTPAKYGLYKTYFHSFLNSPSKGIKKWLHVCRLDERLIGNENLKRAGGRYKRVEGLPLEVASV